MQDKAKTNGSTYTVKAKACVKASRPSAVKDFSSGMLRANLVRKNKGGDVNRSDGIEDAAGARAKNTDQASKGTIAKNPNRK